MSLGMPGLQEWLAYLCCTILILRAQLTLFLTATAGKKASTQWTSSVTLSRHGKSDTERCISCGGLGAEAPKGHGQSCTIFGNVTRSCEEKEKQLLILNKEFNPRTHTSEDTTISWWKDIRDTGCCATPTSKSYSYVHSVALCFISTCNCMCTVFLLIFIICTILYRCRNHLISRFHL